MRKLFHVLLVGALALAIVFGVRACIGSPSGCDAETEYFKRLTCEEGRQ